MRYKLTATINNKLDAYLGSLGLYVWEKLWFY